MKADVTHELSTDSQQHRSNNLATYATPELRSEPA